MQVAKIAVLFEVGERVHEGRGGQPEDLAAQDASVGVQGQEQAACDRDAEDETGAAAHRTATGPR